MARSADEIHRAHRRERALLRGGDELRAGAEDREPLLRRHAPQRAGVRMERRAFIEHERRAGGERAHEPVPHHPAAGREVEEPVAAAHVRVQQVLFLMLQQRAARAVHDAFRHARRARGIEDVERMVEPVGRNSSGAPGVPKAFQDVAIAAAVTQALELRLRAHIGHHDDALDGRQFRQHLAHRCQRIERLARVEVAIGGEQHLGRDLPEAIEHAVDAEVRRARRPDGAEARGGQHRDRRSRAGSA